MTTIVKLNSLFFFNVIPNILMTPTNLLFTQASPYWKSLTLLALGNPLLYYTDLQVIYPNEDFLHMMSMDTCGVLQPRHPFVAPYCIVFITYGHVIS